MEIAVISGKDFNKEILVSVKLMKSWDMIHASFLLESVSQYCVTMLDNKSEKNYRYSSFYTFQSCGM